MCSPVRGAPSVRPRPPHSPDSRVPVSIPRTAASALLVTRGAPAGAVAVDLSGDGAATTLGGSDHAGPVTALIAFAVGGPLNAGLRLREAENGRAWLTWGMATTWLADAAAYLVVPRMGGPSLPASINARKTWLGYVPGMVVASVSGAVFARTLGVRRREGVLLGLALGASAALGDMCESALKRKPGRLTRVTSCQVTVA